MLVADGVVDVVAACTIVAERAERLAGQGARGCGAVAPRPAARRAAGWSQVVAHHMAREADGVGDPRIGRNVSSEAVELDQVVVRDVVAEGVVNA